MPERYLDHDWFNHPLPHNLEMGPNTYLESSYTLAGFSSERPEGLVMAEGSGLYQFGSTVIAGSNARIRIGRYTCLNDCKLICGQEIQIGDHCLAAWRAVITDTIVPARSEAGLRRQALNELASDPRRRFRPTGYTAPVFIEDNVWIGFDSVVCGGVRIGRGAVIGCKAVITENVPPYAVVVGNPPRIVRYLEADDTEEARADAFRVFSLPISPARVPGDDERQKGLA